MYVIIIISIWLCACSYSCRAVTVVHCKLQRLMYTYTGGRAFGEIHLLVSGRSGSARRKLALNFWRKQATTQQCSACSKLTPTGTPTCSSDHSLLPASTPPPSSASQHLLDHLQPPWCSPDSCQHFRRLPPTRDVTREIYFSYYFVHELNLLGANSSLISYFNCLIFSWLRASFHLKINFEQLIQLT